MKNVIGATAQSMTVALCVLEMLDGKRMSALLALHTLGHRHELTLVPGLLLEVRHFVSGNTQSGNCNSPLTTSADSTDPQLPSATGPKSVALTSVFSEVFED